MCVVYIAFIVSHRSGMWKKKDATRVDYIWLYMHSVQCKIPCCLGTLCCSVDSETVDLQLHNPVSQLFCVHE